MFSACVNILCIITERLICFHVLYCEKVSNAVQAVRTNGQFTGDGLTNLARRQLEVWLICAKCNAINLLHVSSD